MKPRLASCGPSLAERYYGIPVDYQISNYFWATARGELRLSRKRKAAGWWTSSSSVGGRNPS